MTICQMAEELSKEDVVMLIGAGNDGNDSLIFQANGLIVNDDRPRVRRSLIRRVRAMIHQQRLGILS